MKSRLTDTPPPARGVQAARVRTYSRRAALGGLAATATTLATPTWAAEQPVGTLRWLKVRHATFLVELDGLRLLFDPWFGREPLTGVALEAPAPSPRVEGLGRVDVLSSPATAGIASTPFRSEGFGGATPIVSSPTRGAPAACAVLATAACGSHKRATSGGMAT